MSKMKSPVSAPFLSVSTQVRIFPPDCIPLATLATVEQGQTFIEFLHCSPAPGENSADLNFLAGSLVLGETRVIVPRLSINERRIIMSVLGTSQQADECFALIGEFLRALDTRTPSPFDPAAPTLKTEESSSSVQLDIQWRMLVSAGLRQFLEKDLLPAVSNELVEAELLDYKVSFVVGFNPKNDRLRKSKIQIGPKEFVIEPRQGTSLEEKHLWFAVPADTETRDLLMERLLDRLSQEK